MSVVEREKSQFGVTPEEMAMKELRGYVEQLERKTEGSNQAVVSSQPKVIPPQVVDDMGKVVLQSTQNKQKPKIILPLDEEEMEKGLHMKIWDGLRWMSEWCVYLIRKYPGRVFYPARESET